MPGSVPLAFNPFSHGSPLFSCTPRPTSLLFSLEFLSWKPHLTASYPIGSLPWSLTSQQYAWFLLPLLSVHSIETSLRALGASCLCPWRRVLDLESKTWVYPGTVTDVSVTLGMSCRIPGLQFSYLRKGSNSSLGIASVTWPSTWKLTLPAVFSAFHYLLLPVSELFKERDCVLLIIIYYYFYCYITINVLL